MELQFDEQFENTVNFEEDTSVYNDFLEKFNPITLAVSNEIQEEFIKNISTDVANYFIKNRFFDDGCKLFWEYSKEYDEDEIELEIAVDFIKKLIEHMINYCYDYGFNGGEYHIATLYIRETKLTDGLSGYMYDYFKEEYNPLWSKYVQVGSDDYDSMIFFA